VKKQVLLVFIAVLLLFSTVIAYANESDRMPPLDNIKKNLTIYFYVQHNDEEIPISGAEISIYKVADLNCNYGSADYTLFSQYSSLKKEENGRDVTFDGISGTEAEKLAKQLSEIVTQPDAIGITNAYGLCEFDDLSQGMYLIIESKSQGVADEYELFSPYLISVPLAVKDDAGNYWKYDVLSEPKTIVEMKTPDSNTDIVINSDTDTNTDTQSDADTNTDVDTESDILSDTESETVNSSDVSSVESGDSDRTINVSSSVSSVYSSVDESRTSSFFDKAAVQTGVISNIILVLFMLLASVLFAALSANKKEGENNDETD